MSQFNNNKNNNDNDGSIELIKLKAEALDNGRLKLATWGTKKQLIDTLRNNQPDPYRPRFGHYHIR